MTSKSSTKIVVPTYIHVGLPKSASSMLQKVTFPNLTSHYYIYDEDLQGALGIEDLFCDEKERKAFVKQKIASHSSQGKPVILSSEHYSMPSDWLETRQNPFRLRRGRYEISATLKDVVDDARILLIVRRQQDWLASWYQERVKRLETRSVTKFLNSTTCRNMCGSLHYSSLYDEYEKEFGEGKVTVIPFELLTENPEIFSHMLCDFLDIPRKSFEFPKVRTRQNSIGISLRRRTNNLVNLLGNILGSPDPIDQSVFRFFKKIYSYDSLITKLWGDKKTVFELNSDLIRLIEMDNLSLQNKIQIDLKELGYFLPSDKLKI